MADMAATLGSGAAGAVATRLRKAACASRRCGGPVMVIGGSLREASASVAVARFIDGEIARKGIASNLFTIEELNLPPFNPDHHRVDRSVAEDFVNAVRRCRAMIWCAPAYHQTISGSFKNVLDFIELTADDKSVYLTGKVIGLVSTSGGVRAAVSCITSMQFVVHALRAFAIPYSVPIPHANHLLDADGLIKDDDVLLKLRLVAQEVEGFVRHYSEPELRPTNQIKHLD